MRLLGLLLVMLAVLGVYLLGGNRLDERHIRAFYEESVEATLALDDERLCAMLADDFEQIIAVKLESSESSEVFDKAAYCDNAAETMKPMRQLRDAMGGRSPVRYSQTLVAVSIAHGRRSAEVELRAIFELPGMRMVSRSRDTVIRKRWKMYGTRSEAVVWAGPAGR